jgi:hypothetical protein
MGKNVIRMLTVLFIIAGYIFGTCIRKFTIIYVYSAKNGRARFDSRQRRRDFSSSLCVQTGSWAHPDSYTMGTGDPFSGSKARPGRDADHSPPCSADVDNE